MIKHKSQEQQEDIPLSGRQLLLQDIGQKLKQAREDKGEAISKPVRKLKITANHLHALEDGNWRSLPDDVYVIGFLRQYSTYLDIDLSNEITRLRNSDYQLTRPLTFPDPPVAPSRRWAWLAGGAFVLLFISFNIINISDDSNLDPLIAPVPSLETKQLVSKKAISESTSTANSTTPQIEQQTNSNDTNYPHTNELLGVLEKAHQSKHQIEIQAGNTNMLNSRGTPDSSTETITTNTAIEKPIVADQPMPAATAISTARPNIEKIPAPSISISAKKPVQASPPQTIKEPLSINKKTAFKSVEKAKKKTKASMHTFRFKAVTSPVWMQVFLPNKAGDGKGKLLKEMLLPKGHTKIIRYATESLWITCGNALALRISVDNNIVIKTGTLGGGKKVLRNYHFDINAL